MAAEGEERGERGGKGGECNKPVVEVSGSEVASGAGWREGRDEGEESGKRGGGTRGTALT